MIWTSLFGIITIVLLARAMGFAGSPKLADGAEAGRIAADALPGFHAAEAALSADGKAALVAGSDGSIALVRAFGDRWVVRGLKDAEASLDDGRLKLRLPEPNFPPSELLLGAAAATWAKRL
jgi:hypothetical protein